MLLDFAVDVTDIEGNVIVGANFNNNFGLRASRKANGIGWFQIALDENQERYAQPDYLVDIYLRWNDIIKPFRSYFVRKRTFFQRTGQGRRIMVEGPCINYLLSSRIVAYAKDSAQASQTDEADDLLKEVARDNLGGDAVTGRDKSAFFTIEGNKAEASSISREMSWLPTWDVIQGVTEDIASDSSLTPIYFDIVKKGPYAFELKTYSGQIGADLTTAGHFMQKHYFSPVLENIGSPQLVEDYSDEVTYVYALPPASGSARVPVEVSDVARLRRGPFARREIAITPNTADIAELTSAGNTALQKGRPKLTFRADLLNTVSFRYGQHWNFGDKVHIFWRRAFTSVVDYVEVGRTQRGDSFEDHFKAGLEIEDVLR